MNGVPIILASMIARAEAESARPLAPVVAGSRWPPSRARRTTRHTTARVLRRLASAFDPLPEPACCQ